MSTELASNSSLTDRVESFAHDFVRPIALPMARGRGPHPKEIVSAAGEAGLAGILTEERFGGAGGSHRQFAAFIESVARECASTAVILDVHLSVGTEPIIIFGDEHQKQRYLPPLARGELLAGFALTEPAGGSDAAAVQTRAKRDGDSYLLTGSKTFITSAGAADLYVVMARTDEGHNGVSAFIVESSWPGVSAGVPFAKMGLHGSWTGELILDSVRVPAENRLGDEGIGFKVAMAALDSGRVGISAQAVGIAQGALDATVAAARTARERGDMLDETVIADMEARTVASRLLTQHAAATVDAGEPVTRDASVAKLFSTDTSVWVAQQAVDLCAPASAADDHPASIRFGDAKACQIYEGTNQIQRVVIARKLLVDTAR
ncbi:MAG TPA: acyl-CoA dehydrogenase family protein [Candidatus Dormibacteraeota bacterium]|nr:acyl-CoA dehydrogenase family protein [Candidatus Dormibacteraeota bacterium]